MVGLALKVVISMVSAPMRSCPEPNAALARSMRQAVEVSVANGAAVPVPVQVTHQRGGNARFRVHAIAPVKSGGAVPKGAT